MSGDAILIVGGGGHAVVVADAAGEAGLPIAGFLDDNAEAPLSGRLDRLGMVAMLERADFVGRHPVILATGDLDFRRTLIGTLAAHAGYRLASVVHPRAYVSPSATVGMGVFIGPGAIVHAEASVGDHTIINTAAVVEHHCVVGENTHIAPNVALGGDVRVGPDTLIGIGASVLPGVRIGAGCMVGAGSAVIRDLGDGATAVGVPAREVG